MDPGLAAKVESTASAYLELIKVKDKSFFGEDNQAKLTVCQTLIRIGLRSIRGDTDQSLRGAQPAGRRLQREIAKQDGVRLRESQSRRECKDPEERQMIAVAALALALRVQIVLERRVVVSMILKRRRTLSGSPQGRRRLHSR